LTQVVTAPESGVAIVRRPTRSRLVWLAIAFVVVAGLAFASISIGSRVVSWDEIVGALAGNQDGLGQGAVTKRIWRTALALLLGAALGVSGAVMQGVTRNPLADPGILGVNMGASLAVVTGIAWFGLWSFSSFIWTAILGAALTAVFVYVVGSLGRDGATPLKLALAGAATSAAAASFISAVVLPRGDIAGSVRSWQIGGVGGATIEAITTVLPFLAVGALICFGCARALNSLALGDELAAGLGERVACAPSPRSARCGSAARRPRSPAPSPSLGS
jgi:iron complex transport system permease protein